MKTTNLALFALVLSASFLSPTNASAQDESWKSAFSPLPAVVEPTDAAGKAKISLGKKLYFDTRLSKDNDISCNSCHNVKTFGVDNEPTSPGHKGQRGARNSPSSFNAALHVAQFWDGRAENVEKQALGPVLNPGEMAMPSEQAVLDRLTADKALTAEFAAAFPGEKIPVTYTNVGNAIGAFERTLITPSRFDDYLKGDSSALTEKEKKGGALFVQSGCIACHNGPTVGGLMYQKLGLVKPYPTKDEGRAAITKQASDKYVFKVPSLRNVEKTGPYFHDGSVKTLDQAVSLMAEHQLGKQLSKEQVDDIVAFLGSLTASDPAKYQ
jgi:cytochrome c peroxidase